MIHFRRSRLLAAMLGIIAMTVGFLLLATAQDSLAANGAASPSSSPSSSHSPSPSSSPSSSTRTSDTKKPGTTVRGPRMYDPAHNRTFARHSTVTVSQTGELVNEMVHVSWTGFTPSSAVLYDPTSTDYPVMVAECNTAHPVRMKKCYGADNGGVQGAFGPFGPMNTSYATTSKKGTGQLDIQIMTLAENQFLGCSVHHRCSLVIVPSQGGDTLSSPAKCHDHSLDFGGTDVGQFAFSSQTGSCSWAKRIIVPLRFAPAPANCPLKSAAFSAIGSPMLLRAMNQWRAGLCTTANPMAFTFNAAITEPAAVADLPTGFGDIALTTRPGPDHIIGKKSYTYAPIAISSVAVAYWVDNPVTGQPVRNLKLNQRLLAKLLTQSYNFANIGCGNGRPPPKKIGCDGAVDGNPFSLFDDPEFKRLNPKVREPIGFGSTYQMPTVESGHSDMTFEVTRWIADNPNGNGFMRGQFDQWGMHVNTNYLGLKYPLDSFTGQDSYPLIAHKYSPVFPLSLVASYQVQNWEPGTDWEKDQFGNFPKDPIQVPGERALFAVLDYGDAAAFRFPCARILNHSHHYVAPSARSMTAAIPSLREVGGNHITQRVNYTKQSAGAYPLTMVIYAMVPTSGEKPTKAASIARFLDYVVSRGQRPGVLPGDLAPGYLPLTAKMRAQTLRAATLVRNQKGNSLHPKPSTSPSPSATSSVASASLSPSPSPTPGQGVHIITQSAQTTGPIRYVLPALLIVGGLATLGGASSLMVGNAATIEKRLRRLRRLRLVRRR